ncbi:cysteine-rich secretory protein LCCL domain-containing 1b [Scleropages formosus]|uniref:Cysteine-rich secretory protein LCCL domain containing 1b n=1 Tax=Scleropages formosus TaxID=113540 RepID=A0A8C9SM20_SCLFO|nr:cysteine-rich secretory protein LCCL domain-containing 1-like [Scleropages formosus]
MKTVSQNWLSVMALLLSQSAVALVIHNATLLEVLLEKYTAPGGEGEAARPRGRRAISESDMKLILDLHNKLRGQVYPPASNMEYMVWDTELERSAEAWAHACRWEHGPANLMRHIGQNLGAHWGRDRPPTFHVQAWYDEVRYYSYPYPQECNSYCPFRCSGPVCTHYTQMVWASSNRIGCAINVCYNMNVWGMIWAKAVYLVCNYSPPGNWWGHAPYQHGQPCSACPPSYGGGCRDNLCFKDAADQRPPEEREESNYVESEDLRASLPSDKMPPGAASPSQGQGGEQILNTQQMSQQVSCETKLRDQCKGTTCNRYECPAGCLHSKANVIGSGFYDMQSSICRAALHSGVIDNYGGWLDVTRKGRKSGFTASKTNEVQTLAKSQSANAFIVSKVPVKAITCETTVEQFCPFEKPVRHCPRLYCPRYCLQETPWDSRVIGTKFYSDKSSICRAAIHAGVLQNDSGGYLDVMPVDGRRRYVGSFRNGVSSDSQQNPPGGNAFRVFMVI